MPLFNASRQPDECPITGVQHICEAAICRAWINNPADDRLTARVVRLTPAIAAQWLERNDQNRPMSRTNATTLGNEMTAGHWRENGESVVFDSAVPPVLMDGQHRLQAVIDTGHEYNCPVISGVEPAARPTVDRGQKRSVANNLQMAGEMNGSALAATIVLWAGYERRTARDMTQSRRMSVTGMTEFLALWPRLREAVTAARKLRPAGQGRTMVPTSEVALVWMAISESGAPEERAGEYLGAVLSGFDLSPGNPILALRRRLQDQVGTAHRMQKRERIALILRTWQLWSAGETRQQIRWEAGAAFPFLARVGPVGDNPAKSVDNPPE
jgi:hypothetical protein